MPLVMIHADTDTPESGASLPLRFWMGAGLIAVISAVILATDIFPIITTDSLDYIGHSNSIATTGFVQLGYRQVGYPAFLASVDVVATALRIEPLLLTVLVQRVIYLSALAFAAWLWRWRALPLISLALLPTLMVYTNFILTEGLALGLVLWYAVLVAWVVRLGSDRTYGEIDARTERTMIISGVLVGVIYLALIAIRFQYILTLFGVLAALYIMYRSGNSGRTAARIVAVTIFILGSGFFALVSQENANEFGPFFPSVRGEGSRFWATWEITFRLEPENREIGTLTDLLADGSPYTVMKRIDALPTYADQQTAYSVAIDRLLDESGSDLGEERIKAFVGALVGGRIDDVHGVVLKASRTTLEPIELRIYQSSFVRNEGIDYFVSQYNDGRPIQSILTSRLTPLRTYPYFASIYRWLLVASALVLPLGIARRETRLLSAVGLVTLGGTALVFGYLLRDDIRYMLIPLVFVVAIATGVADSACRNSRPLVISGHGNTPETTQAG